VAKSIKMLALSSISVHSKHKNRLRHQYPLREQDTGGHKGLVKIPRIFLALPHSTTLAHVLDKSALYGKGISSLTRVGIACYSITYPNILICKGNLNGNPA
jgi:hypothetical protein